MNLVELVGAITFPILERIPVVGDFAISPHGLGIAIGFGLGAIMMSRRAEKRGLGHTYVENIPEAVQNLLTRAAIGAILGARFFYVLTHLDQFQDEPIRVLYAWEGGLTFLGGVTGAILLAIPYARSQGWRMTMLLDSAAPGIALGLAIGRIGDLMIGDHIGAPTDFPLAWKCSANWWIRSTNSFGEVAPLPYPTTGVAPTAGCFDVAVHHTALYDFGATVLVLLVLLLMERRRWFDGAFIAAWVFVYGALRIASDFARNDRTWFGLTGSQWSLVGAMALIAAILLLRKPWRRERWSWDRVFDHPWKVAGFDAKAFEIREGPLLVGAGARSRGAHAVLSAASVDLTPSSIVTGELPVVSPDEPPPSDEELASGSRMRVPSRLFGGPEASPVEASTDLEQSPEAEESPEAQGSPDVEDSPDLETSPEGGLGQSDEEATPDVPWLSEPSFVEGSSSEDSVDLFAAEAPDADLWGAEASAAGAPDELATEMAWPESRELAPVGEPWVPPATAPQGDLFDESMPALDERQPVADEPEPVVEEPAQDLPPGAPPIERPRPRDPNAGPRMARRRDHPGSGA